MPEPSPIAGFNDFDACYAWLMEVDGQPTDYLRAARLLAFSQGEPYPEVMPNRYAVEMEFGKALDRFDMFTPPQPSPPCNTSKLRSPTDHPPPMPGAFLLPRGGGS